MRCLAVLGEVRVTRSRTTLEPVWTPTAVRDADEPEELGTAGAGSATDGSVLLADRRRVV